MKKKDSPPSEPFDYELARQKAKEQLRSGKSLFGKDGPSLHYCKRCSTRSVGPSGCVLVRASIGNGALQQAKLLIIFCQML
jgi:hypothetical protein